MRFLHHTQRRATVGRTPLNEWSVRCRDLYLTTHNTHNRQISMPRVGFEPTISAGEQPKTYALDRAATGTDNKIPFLRSFSTLHQLFLRPLLKMFTLIRFTRGTSTKHFCLKVTLICYGFNSCYIPSLSQTSGFDHTGNILWEYKSWRS